MYLYARTIDGGGGFEVMSMRVPAVAGGVSSVSLCADQRRRSCEKKGYKISLYGNQYVRVVDILSPGWVLRSSPLLIQEGYGYCVMA